MVNVDFRLASTPAMFNSTLTEDEAFFCPADGAIMITGHHKTHVSSLVIIGFYRLWLSLTCDVFV